MNELFALKDGVHTLPVQVIIEGLSEKQLMGLHVHYLSLRGKLRDITETRNSNEWNIDRGYVRGVLLSFPENYADSIISATVAIGSHKFVYSNTELMTAWDRTAIPQSSKSNHLTLQSPKALTINSFNIPKLSTIINWKRELSDILGSSFIISLFQSLLIFILASCFSTSPKVTKYSYPIRSVVPWLSTVLIVGISSVNLIFLLANIRKGGSFFNRDTALMMLTYTNARPHDLLTAAVTIIPRLVFWTPPNILTYRIVWLTVNIGLGGFLCFAFWSWLKTAQEKNRYSLLAVVAGTGLLLIGTSAYPILIMSWPFSHHSLLEWAAMLTASFFLLSLSTKVKNILLLYVLGLGVIAGLVFFVKPPVSFSLSIVILLSYRLSRLSARPHFMKLVVCFTLGIILGVLLFFMLFQAPMKWFDTIKLGIARTEATSHLSAGSLTGRYAQEFGDLVKNLSSPLFLILFGTGFGATFYAAYRRHHHSTSCFGQMAAAMITLIPVWTFLSYFIIETRSVPNLFKWFTMQPFLGSTLRVTHIESYLRHSLPILMLLLLAGSVTAGAALYHTQLSLLSLRNRLSRINGVVVFGFLLVIPLVFGFLSALPLMQALREYIWAWILALLILASWSKRTMNENLRWWIFLLLPASLLLMQQYYEIRYWYGGIQHLANYAYSAPHLPKEQKLLFLKEDAEYYENIYQTLKEQTDYTPGDMMWAHERVHHVVYLLGGKLPEPSEQSHAFILKEQFPSGEATQPLRILHETLLKTHNKIGTVEAGASTMNIPIEIYAPKSRLKQFE